VNVSNDAARSVTPASSSVDAAAPDSKVAGSQSSEAKTFDDVLARKNAERKAKDNFQAPDDSENELALMSSVPISMPPNAGAGAVAKPAGVEFSAPDLKALVHEVVVAAAPGKDPNVEIKFQSTTLEGLNVEVAKKGDAISIRFVTSSNSVAQLLARNLDQLSQGLASKSLNVGVIRIETAPVPSRLTGSRSASRDGSRGGRDGRREQEPEA
jgi:flagellar hook-length control protein FliK